MQQLDFMVNVIRERKLPKTSLTKDGNIRLVNLTEETLEAVLADAEACGIPTAGGYEHPHIKVFSSPLSGMAEGEVFDVRPYADKAREYTRTLQGKTHRKHSVFRIYFAGREQDLTDAADCDMIFLAVEKGLFQVSIRGEEGHLVTLTPKTTAGRFLSYIKAALTLAEPPLSSQDYPGAFWAAMNALSDADRADTPVEEIPVTKKGKGDFTCGPQVYKQKQPDLYAAICHPFAGMIPVSYWKKLQKILTENEYLDVELRMDRNRNLYICNLLADEVHLPLTALQETAYTAAERSDASDRCLLCSSGTVDPQLFVSTMLKGLRQLRLHDRVLPSFTISGCPRCCFAVPKEDLIFITQTDVPQDLPAGRYCQVCLHADHDRNLGFISYKNIFPYLMALGSLVQSSGMDFSLWYEQNSEIMKRLTALYR